MLPYLRKGDDVDPTALAALVMVNQLLVALERRGVIGKQDAVRIVLESANALSSTAVVEEAEDLLALSEAKRLLIQVAQQTLGSIDGDDD